MAPHKDKLILVPALTLHGASRTFLAMFAGLYLAYGTESAYMPAFLLSHGLTLQTLGIVLGGGTLAKIFAGPLAGRLADRLGTPLVLAWCFILAGFISWLYLAAFDVLPLLVVLVAHAVVTAPLAPLADTLAVGAVRAGSALRYGWLRGVGSGAFVVGTLLSGILVEWFGLSVIIIMSSSLFLVTALPSRALTRIQPCADAPSSAVVAPTLWHIRSYRYVVLIAALVIGSHGVNDVFAVISWHRAGIGTFSISLLWSIAVVSEVVVFVLFGPWLVATLGAAGAAAIAAGAGVARWGLVGATTALPALVVAQATHGLTFALTHMVVMDVIARHVPTQSAATAQAFYGTFALGIASALITAAAGYLYADFGQLAFWGMVALCAVALFLTPTLDANVKTAE